MDELFKNLGGFVVLFDEVPFIDQNNHTLPVLFGQVEYIDILGFDAFRSIQHEDDHIRFFQRLDGAHYRIEFDVFLYFGFAAQTGRVNQDEIMQKGVSKGMGLENIRSRIKSLDGCFYINTNPSKGFSIYIQLPLK